MAEHLSYAMRNDEARQLLVSFNPPSALLDWSHLAVELIFLSGIITAIVHAWRAWARDQQVSPLLTIAACTLYGLIMDISSYYTVENFWHGEFSVMLLYNRLPLYIVFLYPALIYHLYMTIRRYEFSPLVEAICVGFLGGVMYEIFDNLGPMLGWWIWDTTDITTWPYLDAVPMTSYYWFFSFTASFAYFTRKFCWDWVATGQGKVKIAIGTLLVPVLTILSGIVLFKPFNLFSRNEYLVEAGALYAVLFAASGFLMLIKARKPVVLRDTLLMVFPYVFLVGHLFIYIAKFSLFLDAQPGSNTSNGLALGNLIAALAGIAVSSTLLVHSQSTVE